MSAETLQQTTARVEQLDTSEVRAQFATMMKLGRVGVSAELADVVEEGLPEAQEKFTTPEAVPQQTFNSQV